MDISIEWIGFIAALFNNRSVCSSSVQNTQNPINRWAFINDVYEHVCRNHVVAVLWDQNPKSFDDCGQCGNRRIDTFYVSDDYSKQKEK